MTIRLAGNGDLQPIMDIYSYAREQMRLSGNSRQWGDNRPALETIKEDIRKKQAYILVEQERICGVFVFIIGVDATYQVIENGAWLNQKPYGTVHRIAGNGEVKGVLATALSFCEDKIDNIRIDTHEDNQIMQHLLEKYEFQKCGYIYVEDGTRRIAYQKVVR